jgi:PHD/YefM family antitoxin component YafN of YafNO toxin-antitoxin module
MKTDDIQPLSEVRPRLTQHFQRLAETGRPLFVTSNGRTAAVFLSPAAYDDLVAKAEHVDHLKAIERGLADVDAGRTTEARQAMRELAAKHGIRFNR